MNSPDTYIAFCSMGNDSIALLQYLHERAVADEIHVVYSNTGWASDEWPARVEKGKLLCKAYGFIFHELDSEGMESLVRRKKGWPMPGSPMQFCTAALKIEPALKFMDEFDPNKEATCCVGIRREESPNRAMFPMRIMYSDNHGGRELFAPLVLLREAERNELILRAGFDVLPHRSRECFPCINANRDTLRDLTESKLVHIETIETEMGFTSNDKPRTMYRPYQHMGATGIREIKRWADSERGKYEPHSQCDSGYCGG